MLETSRFTNVQACGEARTASLRVLLRIAESEEQNSGRQARCGDEAAVGRNLITGLNNGRLAHTALVATHATNERNPELLPTLVDCRRIEIEPNEIA